MVASNSSKSKSRRLFHRMRMRFIAVACLAVAMILIAFTGVLNSVNRYFNKNEIYLILEGLQDNGGFLPDTEGEAYRETTTSSESSVVTEIRKNLTAITLRQARYFSLTVAEDKTLISSELSHISSLTDSNLARFLDKISLEETKAQVWTLGRYNIGLFNYGEVRVDNQHYAYLSQLNEDGTYFITVLDTTYYIANRDDLLSLSFRMSVYSMFFFALVLWRLSDFAIAPYMENYERQKQFITNAGHELKTPLAIISANTEMTEMLEGETEWSKSTRDQTVRLTHLINQMVSLARLEEQPDVTITELNFSAIALDAAEDFKAPVLTDGKTFSLDIAPHIYVKGEEKLLFELVTILVDNANKYCDAKGRVSVKLTQTRISRGRKAKLEVSNHYAAGKGVDYDRFFDRFYREDQSHNSKIRGYGIGLSMANGIVQLFKGKITVSFKDDIITFTVLL